MVYQNQVTQGHQLPGPLARLALDGNVGHATHATGVDDHVGGLPEGAPDVALYGGRVLRLGRLHLPHLAVHDQVGGTHVRLVALAHEARIMPSDRERLRGLHLVRPDVAVGRYGYVARDPLHTDHSTPRRASPGNPAPPHGREPPGGHQGLAHRAARPGGRAPGGARARDGVARSFGVVPAVALLNDGVGSLVTDAAGLHVRGAQPLANVERVGGDFHQEASGGLVTRVTSHHR